jgi:hypothetical protein
METVVFSPSQRDDIIKEWKQSVDLLLDQIASWAQQEPEWKIERQDKKVTEEALGTYNIDSLIITTPEGRMHIDPIARIVFGGRGTVEMFAWPSLFRVRLLRGRTEGEWKVLTDSGFTLRQEWNRDNFVNLAKDLLGAP